MNYNISMYDVKSSLGIEGLVKCRNCQGLKEDEAIEADITYFSCESASVSVFIGIYKNVCVRRAWHVSVCVCPLLVSSISYTGVSEYFNKSL